MKELQGLTPRKLEAVLVATGCFSRDAAKSLAGKGAMAKDPVATSDILDALREIHADVTSGR